MNRSVALGRKIIYLVVLVAMLLPLYLLGQPAGGGSDRGGALSEMRVEYNIAESDLGEISPASETMKLASLGLRGVAATLLWNRSHDYKVMHEWDLYTCCSAQGVRGLFNAWTNAVTSDNDGIKYRSIGTAGSMDRSSSVRDLLR